MKYILLLFLFLAGCGEKSAGYPNDGSDCVTCYEGTNLVGDPAIICRDVTGGFCY